MNRKEQIIQTLRAFVAQHSGIDSREYGGHRAAFLSDYRPMLQAGRHARVMLRAVEPRDSITAEQIEAACKSAFSGRLSLVWKNGAVAVDYTTGQYFPTEYRNAVCAVLASALWAYWRECANCATDGKSTAQPGLVNVGDYIRKQARNELGRGIAARWFN